MGQFGNQAWRPMLGSSGAWDVDRCHPRVMSMFGSSSCCWGEACATSFTMRATQNLQRTRSGRPGEGSPGQVVEGRCAPRTPTGVQQRWAHGMQKAGGSPPKKPNTQPMRAGRHCGDPGFCAGVQAETVTVCKANYMRALCRRCKR